MKKEEIEVKILNTPPPKKIMKRANRQFGVTFETTTFTYGECIHTSNPNPTLDLIDHEKVHVKQQTEMGKDEWWDKYFADPKFRLEQELPAYQKQFKTVQVIVKDRNMQTRILWNLALDLSGPMYGKIMLHSDAMRLIRNKR